jgi:iron complex transport system substrate-binding protein
MRSLLVRLYKLPLSYLLLIVLGFASCNRNSTTQQEKNGLTNTTPFRIRHATLFSISYHTGYKKIKLYNPWKKGEVYYTYLLRTDSNAVIPATEKGIIVKLPVASIITFSSTHIGLLEKLDLREKLIGASNPGFIYDEVLRKKVASKAIIEVGHQNQLNVEKIIDTAPGLLMTTGFEDFQDNLKLIEKAGIPVAYNLEYMETSMLARAEWLKFMAAFFNCDQLADSIFNAIEHNYNSMRTRALAVKNKPSILTGGTQKGTWYVPGGNSYIAQLLTDAGADYRWKSDASTGSIPMNVEQILENQIDSDIWINPPRLESLEEIVKSDERYSRFKAVKDKNVYAFTKRELPSGANDYWESGLVNPDLVLADLIKILHPELLQEHQLIYYKKLD